MKANIHPHWFINSKVTCSCGNTFDTGSTLETIQVDICSACHPFYTGEMKFVDVQGRVEKFQAKADQAKNYADIRKAKLAKKAKKQQEAARSLKEVLSAIKTAEPTTNSQN